MAITNIRPIIVATDFEGGFDIAMEPYTDASAATYKTGAALIASGGDLIEATSFTSTAATLIGFALQPGSNIAATHVANSVGNAGVQTPLLQVPATPGQVFQGVFGSNGSDVTVAATDLWVKYGLSKDSTSGYWYVDKNRTTTNAAVLIVGIKNQQDIVLGTTVGVTVYFKCLVGATSY